MALKNMNDVAEFIRNMKFKRQFFNGVNELDVLKQMEALQQLYQSVYDQQAVHFQALLAEKEKQIERLKRGYEK